MIERHRRESRRALLAGASRVDFNSSRKINLCLQPLPQSGAAATMAMAARQSMALLMSAKKAATPKGKTPKKSHHHEHHDPHLPEGVNAGDWDKWVHMFEKPGWCPVRAESAHRRLLVPRVVRSPACGPVARAGATMVEDGELVKTWTETMCAAWIACVNDNYFEEYADKFLTHHIDGPLLLKLYALRALCCLALVLQIVLMGIPMCVRLTDSAATHTFVSHLPHSQITHNTRLETYPESTVQSEDSVFVVLSELQGQPHSEGPC